MRQCVLFVVVSCVIVSTIAHAQWLNFPTPGTPRTPDGKPNLKAPPPRTAEDRPDLSGVWMHEQTTLDEMKRLFGPLVDAAAKVAVPGMEVDSVHKYAINILTGFKPEEVSLRPEGVEAMRRRAAELDPANVCMEVPGWPLAGLLSEPIKIVQAPRATIVLYEAGSLHRQIYSDGRPLPTEINFPGFLGYSVGRWEKDVFVVDTSGFNDKTRFDILGHGHSDALRITERLRRPDFGHLEMELTIDDPKTYTKPFTIKIPHTLLADADIFESFCENEKDREHLKKANPRPPQ
jgi:hypothetical protein